MNAERVEPTTKYLHIGEYIAEVDVQLIYDPPGERGWGPYLSHDDALKLDRIRRALRDGHVAAAAREARVYRVERVAAE